MTIYDTSVAIDKARKGEYVNGDVTAVTLVDRVLKERRLDIIHVVLVDAV